MEATYISSSFLHGLVVPIQKGHHKVLSLPNNYQGITILSNLSKVLEKLLLYTQNPPVGLSPSFKPSSRWFQEASGLCPYCIYPPRSNSVTSWEGEKSLCYIPWCKKGFWYCMASRPACETSPKGDQGSNLPDNWQMVHLLNQFCYLG